MNDERKRARRKRGGEGAGGDGSRMGKLALWQRLVVLLAVLLMVAGVGIGVLLGGGGEGGGTGVDPGVVRGLAPTEGGAGSGAAAAEEGTDWSPVVFRLGFGAFAGFAIGYALRSFLKLSLFALGFFFLMLLGLEYAEVIEVRWASVEDRYDEATTWLGAQTRSFVGFVTGQIPAAGAALAGLAAGLKRK